MKGGERRAESGARESARTFCTAGWPYFRQSILAAPPAPPEHKVSIPAHANNALAGMLILSPGKRAGTSLCTRLCKINIHKRQVHIQSLD